MGLLGALFGTKAKNKAYPFIQTTFGAPTTALTGQGAQANTAYNNALGLNGEQAQGGAYDMYRQSTGFNQTMDDAGRSVTSSAAARGLLGSGSTAIGLQTQAAQLGNQNYQQYLDNLNRGAQTSFGAAGNFGQLMSGAGSVGSSPGIFGQIGQAAGGIAALRRR